MIVSGSTSKRRNDSLFLEQPLRLAAQAAARAERRRHLPAARRAGGAADARRRRQRGGRDPRHRDHAVAGRAGVERHRLGCLRARLGRTQTARPERFGALAGRVDARLLPRQTGHAGARLGHDHRAGRRIGMGRDARQVRQAAVPQALRAGDPLRPRRLSGLADDRGTVAVPGRQAEGPARLRPGVPAGRTRAARRRKIRVQETRLGPGKDRGHEGQGLLSRRAGRKARGGGEETRRRAARVRLGGAPARLGEAARDGLSRLHAARDPAQRPGHRGADRARHPRQLRLALAPGRRRRQRAPADRGGEARLRRWLALRRRHRPHGRAPAGAARQGIPEVEVEAHRSQARAGFRPRQPAERRHGVPHRGRCVRHDGLLHPVELHGLRLGSRGGRHLAAEPRQQLRARAGPSQLRRTRQAPVPDHHSRLCHEKRPARDELRRDGRHHAAAGPHAGDGAHRRLRAEPAGGLRRPALPCRAGHGSERRGRLPRCFARGAEAPRASHRHGGRLQPVRLRPDDLEARRRLLYR